MKSNPEYYQIIPEYLWQEADLLISYLKYFPFSPPTECPHYFGENYYLYTKNKSRGPICSYYCNDCRKSFNRLTNTPFARMVRLELLSDIGYYYLSGLSPYEISDKVGFVRVAVVRREQAILWLMEQEYPQLYQWWIEHYQYLNLTTTRIIDKQKKQFAKWLKDLLNPPQTKTTCPVCHSLAHCYVYNDYPALFCKTCNTTIRLVGQTALKNMHNANLWPRFAELLMLSSTNQDICKALPISAATCGVWRKKFLKQMEILQFNELVYWINWQRQRNRIISISKLRKGKHRGSKKQSL